MAFCPNCSVELASAFVPTCPNCGATFTSEAGWRPTTEPVGTYVAKPIRPPAPTSAPTKEIPPKSAMSWALRAVLAVPLFYLSANLFRMVSWTAGGSLPYACLLAGAALFVLLSRPGLATGISVALALCLLLAGSVLLLILGAILSVR